MNEEDKIELRSEEFQEVLRSVFSWILWWGITLLAVIIMILLFSSATIKYPDVLSSQSGENMQSSLENTQIQIGQLKESLLDNSVIINLTDGLTITYKKELPYLSNMQGQADIITEDLSQLERFILPIKKL
jgi:HlyD family secretion protein